MNAEKIKNTIQNALSSVPEGAFYETGTALLDAMGYRSQLTLPGRTGKPEDFISEFPADNPGTQSEQDLLDAARSIRILFQYTDSEIEAATQPSLFDPASFYTGNARSFMFIAVELAGDTYPRGQYTKFTRELNKRVQAPVAALFRTPSNRVTLAFVHRRPNKLDSTRDVLGRVSLIREIEATKPHRAHLDILAELSLDERLKWMDDHAKPHNFDGLLDAWLDALDTEELNRRFYRDLFRWFEGAVKVAKFPIVGANVPSKNEEHVIRLITRMLFVWFIKEKDLVSEDLFIENQVSELLKGYDRADGDSYYRAILQNLFFATLNTDIDERRFSRRNYDDHRDPSLYRYLNEMADPDRLLTLFRQTPFINGGLFDCLDTFEGARAGGVRIDCFTDNVNNPRRSEYRILSIPNRLFFGEDGLITLFERYKFTVEENTPADTEVALDPELLGKVFENLLAAFNPETRKNVRKQTGSYYTPRAVVDYMVDEALVASLLQKVPEISDKARWEKRLRYLLDYDDAFDDADELFTPEEREAVVEAIAGIKVLDPAVGSGAFPMGILHKLTLALHRLDPYNEMWEELQKELARDRASDAFDTTDQSERDDELREISDTFEKYRESDFGRKLYLIQNSIYGVDIQPVATQIAKLRFFISLAIEQQSINDVSDNYGIKPLPNLETRFVAANTLLPLQGGTAMLTSSKTREIQDKLQENRERHFHATTRSRKLQIREEDRSLRDELAAELENIGLESADARKVAEWDPYDQNSKAGWFDPGYMFGLTDGFDMVIGNPPYGLINKRQNKTVSHVASEEELEYYKNSCEYIHAKGGPVNVFRLFVVKSVHLLKEHGVFAEIFPLAFAADASSSNLRKYLLNEYKLIGLEGFPERDNVSKRIFEAVKMSVCILMLTKTKSNIDDKFSIRIHSDRFIDAGSEKVFVSKKDIQSLDEKRFTIPLLQGSDLSVIRTIYKNSTTTIQDIGHCYTGEIDLTECKKYLTNDSSKSVMIKGAIIDRYQIKREMSQGEIEFLDSEMYLKEKRGKKTQHHNYPRIAMQGMTGVNEKYRLKMTLIPKNIFCANSVNYILSENEGIDSRYLLALLNSSTLNFVFSKNSTNSNVNGYEVDNLPIFVPNSKQQALLARQVDKIIEAKSADPNADTSELEESIDWLVYDLYDLTDEETAVIADYFWDGDMTQEEEDAAFVKMMEEELAKTDERVSVEEIRRILRA